jgi:HlyD family secretion protein
MKPANDITAPRQDRWRMRPLLLLGYLTVFMLVFGFGAWAAVTRIAGAVVSTGTLEVEGKRQVVQHQTGGIVAEINARNGDEVKAGDVLVRLDGEDLGPELDTVEGQWLEILARKSRLDAERDGLTAITFNPELIRRQDDPRIGDLMRAQLQQFEARRKLQADEAAQLNEQQIQIAKQNEGLDALGRSTRDQIDLISREIGAQQTLMDQGLTQMTRLLTPQRELARLQGTAGQVKSSLAENRGKIAELEIELVRLTSKTREEAIAELRELEFREIELREKRRGLKEQISRLDLRAPSSGIVYGSTVDTLRGVVRAAEPVMYVVPKGAPIIIKARVDTIHIDQVHVGQEAVMRFSAFDSRTTPEVFGHVTSVSADAYQDERLGQHYYEAVVSLDPGQLDRLDHVELLPGMPVEAFIRTADRSALSYLVKPMSDYFTRAFREG